MLQDEAAIVPAAVLRCLIKESIEAAVRSKHQRYDRVQTDELWMYGGKETKEGVAVVCLLSASGRDTGIHHGQTKQPDDKQLAEEAERTGNQLVSGGQMEVVCRGSCVIIGISLESSSQKRLKGLHTWFRVRTRRLSRRTTCFSKKLVCLYAVVKHVNAKRNQHASYI